MTTESSSLEAALAEFDSNDPEPEAQDEASPSKPGPSKSGVDPKESDEKEEAAKPVGLVREVDAIVGDPGLITLESGLQCRVIRMKTREFFRLLRIITHGAMPALMSMNIDFDLDDEAFMQRLLTLVLMAVPESEQQSIEFIEGMCVPLDLNEGSKQTKTQIQENADKWSALEAELANPELSDTITIIEAVVKQESEDIKGLGKRLGQIWTLAQKTGQLPTDSSSGS